MKKGKFETDITESINKMHQQLFVLEKKIDALIGRAQPARNQNPVDTRQQGLSYRERVMYKTVCADCRKECEVPFKPSGERPVYCKECFSKRKAASSFKPKPPSPSPRGEPRPAQAPCADKPRAAEKKPVAKKKPAVKKRKAKAKR